MGKEVIVVKENTGFNWRDYSPEVGRPLVSYCDITLLTMCIWGEARGEDLSAQIAVGCTVRNRVDHPRWWGATWREVILKRYQYSAFNERDPNAEKMKDPLKEGKGEQTWRQCLWVAWGVYHNLVEDVTGNATHYHQRNMRKYPSWAQELTRTKDIGPFILYTALSAAAILEENS